MKTLDRGAIQTDVSGLTVRELGPGDAENFYALVQSNRAHLTAFGDFKDEVAAPLEKWMSEFATDPDAGKRLGIFLHRTLIGRVDLIAVAPPRYSLGYWLAKGATGRGYAKAALQSVTTVARCELGATDIYAGVTHGNVRSEALLKRLGFSHVASFEHYNRFHLSL